MGLLSGMLGAKIKCPTCGRGATVYSNAKVGLWTALGRYNGFILWKCNNCSTYIQIRALRTIIIDKREGEKFEAVKERFMQNLENTIRAKEEKAAAAEQASGAS